MPRNLEVKARITDQRWADVVRFLMFENPSSSVHQVDTLLIAPEPNTWIHVREQRDIGTGKTSAKVIRCVRNEHATEYTSQPIVEPDTADAMVERLNLPLIGRVEKRRIMFNINGTKIHFDDVCHLGKFIEIEVVLSPSGQDILNTWCSALAIKSGQLEKRSYVEMLRMRSSALVAQPPSEKNGDGSASSSSGVQ